jgi:hypothetical protein
MAEDPTGLLREFLGDYLNPKVPVASTRQKWNHRDGIYDIVKKHLNALSVFNIRVELLSYAVNGPKDVIFLEKPPGLGLFIHPGDYVRDY